MNVRELKDLLDQFPDDMPIQIQDQQTSKQFELVEVDQGMHRDPYDQDWDRSVVKITITSKD